MLKNKEERKSFLLNKDNWTQSFDLSEIGMVISHLILPEVSMTFLVDLLGRIK